MTRGDGQETRDKGRETRGKGRGARDKTGDRRYLMDDKHNKITLRTSYGYHDLIVW